MRLLFALLLALPLHAQTFDLTGFLTARGVNAGGPPSWLAGGFGRLGTGGDRNALFATAQAGIDWTPVPWFDVHVSGIARREPESYGGDAVGIVEAYADLRAVLPNDTIQLRAGQFFLPTSRENRGALWTSPYTISFSALNTWIGEELRPIGADLEWRHVTGGGYVLTGAATAFQGNDSLGALLGWRGWTVGNRLSVYNEVLPLPPIVTLPTLFPSQRDDGTKPFGPDLDGRTGFAGRARFSAPERAMIQVAWVDNRGDRALSRGEYAWATEFTILSAEVGHPDRTIVAAEYAIGESGMGFRGTPWVQMDLHAGYLLVSHKRGRNRISGRFDAFGTSDRDGSRAETNEESGRSWTFAWLYDVTPKLRGGVEFTQITGDRVPARESGFDPSTDARSLTVELRYAF